MFLKAADLKIFLKTRLHVGHLEQVVWHEDFQDVCFWIQCCLFGDLDSRELNDISISVF